MRNRSRVTRFLHVLRQFLPGAELSVIHERPWYSLTFSGAQICVSAVLGDEHHVDTATHIATILPELNFEMRDQLVADIAVIETVSNATQSRLMIDALLLDV
jgi:hypothetical protein